jgi:hypothetical protein
MSTRARIHVLIAAALVLAGCGAPVAPMAASAPTGATQAKRVLPTTVAVDWLVNALMTDNDANHTGVLDMEKQPWWKLQSPETVGASLDPELMLLWQYQRKLFIDSDENKDKKLTREELDKKIRSYDVDGNGKLHARGWVGALKKEAVGELDKLDKDYRLTLFSFWK